MENKSVSLLDRVLAPPSYGFSRNGQFYVPTSKEILREFFCRLNCFKSVKNWLPLFGWMTSLSFAIPLGIFFVHFFSWPLFFLGLFYSMVILGSHGTFWLHRYSTHRAFRFKNKWVREICRNLVIKIIPEEIYVISHHVHHRITEKPGDPYNVHGGWLYCFLADVNHQTVNKNLNEKDYRQVCKLLEHTGVLPNTFAQYQRWGSVCHPARTIAHYVLNWTFWYSVFYYAGGHALATALFGFSGVWAIGVRTFNYDGHGRGVDRRRDGIDFNRNDLSINQIWPGYVAGEWHNNHHLFPNGARSGFLSYQLDLPWLLICALKAFDCIYAVRDYKREFLKTYSLPHITNDVKLAPLHTQDDRNQKRSFYQAQTTETSFDLSPSD